MISRGLPRLNESPDKESVEEWFLLIIKKPSQHVFVDNTLFIYMQINSRLHLSRNFPLQRNV